MLNSLKGLTSVLSAFPFEGMNRSVLFELGITSHIMEFLGKSERIELQVFAVILLTNCLEDPKILKV
jgi:hypothetical protein